jgi:hypothetical protein
MRLAESSSVRKAPSNLCLSSGASLTRRPTGAIIFTFGVAFGPAVRSFLTALVPQNEVALLYTLISILTAIGSMIGNPTIAYMFSKGIEAGGAALGLPFFFGATFYGLSAICVWVIPSSTRVGHEGTSDALEAEDEITLEG